MYHLSESSVTLSLPPIANLEYFVSFIRVSLCSNKGEIVSFLLLDNCLWCFNVIYRWSF
jgi:hypothetical protein